MLFFPDDADGTCEWDSMCLSQRLEDGKYIRKCKTGKPRGCLEIREVKGIPSYAFGKGQKRHPILQGMHL